MVVHFCFIIVIVIINNRTTGPNIIMTKEWSSIGDVDTVTSTTKRSPLNISSSSPTITSNSNISLDLDSNVVLPATSTITNSKKNNSESSSSSPTSRQDQYMNAEEHEQRVDQTENNKHQQHQDRKMNISGTENSMEVDRTESINKNDIHGNMGGQQQHNELLPSTKSSSKQLSNTIAVTRPPRVSSSDFTNHDKHDKLNTSNAVMYHPPIPPYQQQQQQQFQDFYPHHKARQSQHQSYYSHHHYQQQQQHHYSPPPPFYRTEYNSYYPQHHQPISGGTTSNRSCYLNDEYHSKNNQRTVTTLPPPIPAYGSHHDPHYQHHQQHQPYHFGLSQQTLENNITTVDGRSVSRANGGATSPSQIEMIQRDEVQHMGCTCKKTKCLKLYCQCFQIKIYCGTNCHCHNCYNNKTYEKHRKESIRQILSRNPSAFDNKFKKATILVPTTIIPTPTTGTTTLHPGGAIHHMQSMGGTGTDVGAANDSSTIVADNTNGAPLLLLHKTGCKCHKSNCMKKYCECFAAGVKCNSTCRCIGCKNMGDIEFQNLSTVSPTSHSVLLNNSSSSSSATTTAAVAATSATYHPHPQYYHHHNHHPSNTTPHRPQKPALIHHHSFPETKTTDAGTIPAFRYHYTNHNTNNTGSTAAIANNEPWVAAQNLTFLKRSSPRTAVECSIGELDALNSLTSLAGAGTTPYNIDNGKSKQPSVNDRNDDKDDDSEDTNPLLMAAVAMTKFGQSSPPSARQVFQLDPFYTGNVMGTPDNINATTTTITSITPDTPNESNDKKYEEGQSIDKRDRSNYYYCYENKKQRRHPEEEDDESPSFRRVLDFCNVRPADEGH